MTINQIPQEVYVEATYAYVSQVIHLSVKNEHSLNAIILKIWLFIKPVLRKL